jgi:ABC-type transport system involved in multi-copper enzyme maturation permease subunit
MIMLRLLMVFFGPIFAKEMIEFARRPRYYLLRVLYCAILLFFVYTAYSGISPSASIAEMSRIANEIFSSVMVIQFLTVVVIVPAMLGGSIAGERAAGSLDLLRISILSDREILLGKLTSRLGAVFLLVLAALPVLALAGLWGGIDLESLLLGQLSMIEAMVFAGSLAMYFSARAPVALGAIIQTYVWLVLWCYGRLILQMIAVDHLTNPNQGMRWAQNFVLAVEVFINPLALFILGMEPFSRPDIIQWLGNYYWAYSAISIFAISGLLLHRAHARLATGYNTLHRENWIRRWLAALGRKRTSRLATLAHRPITINHTNPLAQRAQAALVYDRGGYLFRAQIGGIAIAVIVIYLDASYSSSGTLPFLFTLVFGWVILVLPIGLLGSWCFYGDRKSGFLEMVLSTPLEGRTIVDGTFISLWWHLWPAVAFLVGMTLATTVGANALAGPALFITGLLFCSIILMLGMMCALIAGHYATGMMATLSFPVLFGGILLTYLETNYLDLDSIETVLAILVPCGVLLLWTPLRPWTLAISLGAIYFGLAYLLNSWNQAFIHNQAVTAYPSSVLFPLTWVDILLSLSNEGKIWKYDGVGKWWQSLGCYWLAMVMTIAWARWWLIRHFDRLAGRTLARPDGMPKTHRQPA